MTIKVCSENLRSASKIAADFKGTFQGIQFDANKQAVEVFLLQALAMSSSHCRAGSLLLDAGCLGEAIAVLRSVQELLFDVNWILKPFQRNEQLERVYQLEGDPYSRWDKEVGRIQKKGLSQLAERLQDTLDAARKDYPRLLANGSDEFKSAPSFAHRIGEDLRPKYYHVYCFGSLFTHPTPMTRDMYLKSESCVSISLDKYVQATNQFIAYTLYFMQMILTLAEVGLGNYALTGTSQRAELTTRMGALVRDSNDGYFHFSQPIISNQTRPT
jgi:hypothetical protein